MTRPEAIVMGCSAGGLNALNAVLERLDARLPQAIVVCCHTGSSDVGLLCELLAHHSALPVTEAQEREPITGGHVHVAPTGYHLLIEPSRHFALSVDGRVAYSRPSIDVLFESAAEAYRSALVGVVMTGANRDGALGLAEIRSQGGYAIVEDPATAHAAAMPRAALDTAGADACLPLADIAALLNRLCLP
ncbi:MAG TPA: chemotaxis protein CheB [Luteibacter sp.]|jgi:two-component system chemotaxis response regulator CheB|nr:chemotaxis protein CheB [Luteibacter sp.]